MNTCEHGNNLVVYASGRCPLCEAEDDLSELNKIVGFRDDEIIKAR